MAVKYVRWGRALGVLAVVWAQVTACGSSAKKAVAPDDEDTGSDQGGASGSGGKAPSGGTAGKPHTGGAPSDAGSGQGDAGAAGTASGQGDAGAAGASSGGSNAAGGDNAAGSAGAASGAPHVISFGGPTSACAGTKIDLTYSYSGGTGVITPGNLPASLAGGSVQATLPAEDTTYTLTVTGAGDATAKATTKVTSVASPSAVITTAATAVHGDTLVAASVPVQANVTYAWSIASGNATINGAANKNTVAFDVGATGTEVLLHVVVTSSLSTCSRTSDLHIPIPCAVPTLVSLDRAQTPAAQYVPNNEDTGDFDMTGNGNIWTAYLNAKTTTASYNGTFNHYSSGKWGVPSGSPAFLNDTVNARLLYLKVATDSAGDAVFVWTQTSDNNNYQVMVASYRASSGTWSTAQTVGTVFNQETPAQVKIDRSTGVALIAWVTGPYGSIIPHLRSYTVSTNALGADLALRPSTTNTFTGDYMAFSLETNDSLTGFAAWYENDSSTNLDSLYALHITKGVPDTVATAYDIKTLAVATATYTTDVFNYNSVHPVSASREPRMIAVASNGNGAVVWGVYNGLSTGTVHGQLYVRRYASGAWAAPELAASQGPGYSAEDWAIDDAGNVITEVWTNNVGFDFFSGVVGSAWSAPQHLTDSNGASALPNVALDSTSGKGIATYRDPSLGIRAPLRGAFYDPAAHALSPAFTIDDPQQSGGEGGHVRIDGTGLATVFYTQMPKVLPGGANSSNSSLLFSTTCK